MDNIIVRGGNKLYGTIEISGAKNAALPILASSLLFTESLKFYNIPNVVDINTMLGLLGSQGVIFAKNDDSSISIDAHHIHTTVASYDIVRKMRASIWVLGPLLSRFGHAEVSMPGGCAIGARMVDQHIAVLEKLGATITVDNGYICAKADNKLKGAHYSFTKTTVGGTIQGILAAVCAEGESVFTNCACEPEIVDLCNFLNKAGAQITGVGTTVLKINGVPKLRSTEYQIIGDRIEAGTYFMAIGMAGGEVKFKGIDYHLVENIVTKLENVGLSFKIKENEIVVSKSTDFLNSIDLHTAPYPGFATDLQAQYMSLMTIGNGVSMIIENIFENRFMHAPELCRMGADIHLDGHTAIVKGVKSLNGAEVMASDLRASVSLILAGLAANGLTKLKRVYHLDRGYEHLERKLQNCGADITRVREEMK